LLGKEKIRGGDLRSFTELGELAREFLKGHPVQKHDKLMSIFLKYHKRPGGLLHDVPSGMSYWLPKHLGGLGLPWTRSPEELEEAISGKQRLLATYIMNSLKPGGKMLRPFPGEEADFPPYIQEALQRDSKLQIPCYNLDVSILKEEDLNVISRQGDWESDSDLSARVARVLDNFTSACEEETDCRWVSFGSKIGSTSYSSSLWESTLGLPSDLKELERAPFRARRVTEEERAEERLNLVDRRWRRMWDRCVSERGVAPLDVLMSHNVPKFVLPGGLSEFFDVVRPVPYDILGRVSALSGMRVQGVVGVEGVKGVSASGTISADYESRILAY